jgi:putative transposase
MAEHKGQFRLSSMCRVLRVQRSGYYAWKANPKSKRALADDVLLASIRQFFDDSHGIYGSPRILRDLREEGVTCGQKRVARLMRQAQLRSVRGYKRPRYRVGLPATAAPNRLQREFTVTLPNQVWVTDITYIRTHEGWLYLTAVIDLYSRMVVGWSMNSSMATELVLDALTMAVWRRRPTGPVMIHSDQGSQFGSDDFARWCKDNQLVPSMSRRGNCWDNAVAESFFSSLKNERIKRQIYATRQDAKSDVFDYIEGFYNRIRRHSHLDQLSPLAFEQLTSPPKSEEAQSIRHHQQGWPPHRQTRPSTSFPCTCQRQDQKHRLDTQRQHDVLHQQGMRLDATGERTVAACAGRHPSGPRQQSRWLYRYPPHPWRKPMSERASAGASLMPSPTMPTFPAVSCRLCSILAFNRLELVFGQQVATKLHQYRPEQQSLWPCGRYHPSA